MKIGIPSEVKNNETRVGMTPAGVSGLSGEGHPVVVQKGAGNGCGFPDREYRDAGARILDKAEDVYAEADMIVKVKEPQPEEFGLLRQGQILFAFLHLAPDTRQTQALLERGVVGIAYETIEGPDGSLPLLTPMSEIAGRLATQKGAQYLEKPNGGRGLLLGGVPGVLPAAVVIVGGGTVGTNAAKMAIGLGADVTILDIHASRLRYLDDIFGSRIKTLGSTPFALMEQVARADLLIGAVLIPGARAPRLVTGAMVRRMRPGTVLVDVAIDQGGCIETVDRATTHSEPVYEKHGVIHYSVANIPGAVSRTSTLALTNATEPYVLRIAALGWQEAVRRDPGLARGVNVCAGSITHRAVADSTGLAGFCQLEDML